MTTDILNGENAWNGARIILSEIGFQLTHIALHSGKTLRRQNLKRHVENKHNRRE
jgi:hypothetical protein